MLEEQLGVSKRGLGRAELVAEFAEKVRGETDKLLLVRVKPQLLQRHPRGVNVQLGGVRHHVNHPVPHVVGDEIASLLHEF